MIITDKTKITINPSNFRHYYQYYNDIEVSDIIEVKVQYLTKYSKAKIDVICDYCGKRKTIQYKNYQENNEGKYMCSNCKRKKNNKEKYGVENVFQLKEIKNKSKNTIKQKYNVENISQSEKIKKKKKKTNKKNWGTNWPLSSSIIKEKTKETLQKKYGVSNISQIENIKIKKQKTCYNNYGVKFPLQSESIKEKVKKTNLKNYGVEYNLQNKDVKEKIKKTNLGIYGVENVSNNKEISNKKRNSILNTLHAKMYKENEKLIEIDGDNLTLKCDLGKNHNYKINRILYYKRRETNTTLCTVCNPIHKNISGLKIKLKQFLDHLNVNYQRNIKLINPYEVDFYLIDYNIAFEFNGVYWHNELNKPNNYHKMKSDLCEEKGIQLIHIWEDDWLYNNHIIKSMILNKLGKTTNKIYARNCEIREINDTKIVKNFLKENHLQGYIKSKYKIGLFKNNELVSLMLFGKTRNNNLELTRFCNKKYLNVVGGASKLFHYFINKYQPNELITYANRDYSHGKLYEKLNFNKIKFVKPNYSYVVNGIRIHKSNYRKENLIKQGYNKKHSEHEIMLNRNIFRIYNSGFFKYSFKNKN